MSFRACIYKSCKNYINLKERTANDVKLFSFPKNPERRQKWIDFGKVPSNVPESMYYFCSDHFDKRFLAVTNRRTTLVGEAVPFPYVEHETIESNGDDELNYYLYEMGKNNSIVQEYLDNQDLLVESTTTTIELPDILHDDQISNNTDEQESDKEKLTEPEKNHQEYSTNYGSKRKFDNTILQGVPPKSKILKTFPTQKPIRKSFDKTYSKISQQPSPTKSISSLNTINQITVATKETNEDDMDVDQLIDAQHVTCFIYKGEEYVQMPKVHYINEKIEIYKKIRKMEHTLKIIKEHLNGLDI